MGGRGGLTIKIFDVFREMCGEHSCGQTFETIERDNHTEVQCIVAIPVSRFPHPDAEVFFTESIVRLTDSGLLPAERHAVSNSGLVSGVEREDQCPYRPDECVGEHVSFAIHGLAFRHRVW